MSDLLASFKILSNGSVLNYLYKGVLFTIVLSLICICISFVLGSILAMLRNYCRGNASRFLGYAATAYIEIFRNTPLMLWMFICFVFCPTPSFPQWLAETLGLASTVDLKTLFKAIVALTLFTSSVMAEIIRGGLNSLSAGQFEAGYSQGFNTMQVMIYIILPQAYRNIIPTLLSQVITTIKDSSYLASLATIEFMARVKLIISKANEYNGSWVDISNRGTINVTDVFVLFGFAFIIYFIINLSISTIVRRMKLQKA